MSAATVILFSKEGCAPCQVVKAAMDSIREDDSDGDYKDWVWKAAIDISKDRGVEQARGYNVLRVPCVIVEAGDMVIGRHEGASLAALQSMLRAAKATHERLKSNQITTSLIDDF